MADWLDDLTKNVGSILDVVAKSAGVYDQIMSPVPIMAGQTPAVAESPQPGGVDPKAAVKGTDNTALIVVGALVLLVLLKVL